MTDTEIYLSVTDVAHELEKLGQDKLAKELVDTTVKATSDLRNLEKMIADAVQQKYGALVNRDSECFIDSLYELIEQLEPGILDNARTKGFVDGETH